ncbi:MAG: type II toxin-antitoxin system MqsA family antitoxin [Oscillospiraceae bacterium]|nr:type II toxin-antitoxin system MqsA family antitoxin [Oscillospiraceae bacterium]
MTCFFCKGAMQAELTTHLAQVGGCIVVVKGVPCSKCTQCGEVTYNGAVAGRLEQITDELEKSLTEIAVVNYSAA